VENEENQNTFSLRFPPPLDPFRTHIPTAPATAGSHQKPKKGTQLLPSPCALPFRPILGLENAETAAHFIGGTKGSELVPAVEVVLGKQAYLRSGFRMYFKSPSAQVRVK
jgi:hypothetical protein